VCDFGRRPFRYSADGNGTENHSLTEMKVEFTFEKDAMSHFKVYVVLLKTIFP